MSLGVGVDLRVDNAVMFGLSETAENLLQEGGRAMRGSSQETAGKHGFAFFFQKGHLGKDLIKQQQKQQHFHQQQQNKNNCNKYISSITDPISTKPEIIKITETTTITTTS